MKRKLKKKIAFHSGVIFGGTYMRLVFSLSRNRYIGIDHMEHPLRDNRSVLLAFWHGQIMGFSYMLRHRNIHAIVGYHRDAEMIARIISRLGYGLIRGSSRDRGKEALSHAIQIASNPGSLLTITCDGPIGPHRIAKPGVGIVAQKTGAVIVPVGVNGSRKKVLRDSWDNFYVHLPFGTNVAIFGEPIFPEDITGSNAIKETISKVNNRLNAVQETADMYFDQDPE